MIRHKTNKLDIRVDVSRRYILLNILETKVPRFKLVKEMYARVKDLMETFDKCSGHVHEVFHLEEGSLLK